MDNDSHQAIDAAITLPTRPPVEVWLVDFGYDGKVRSVLVVSVPLGHARVGLACNLSPSASITLRMVSKPGLRSPESAL